MNGLKKRTKKKTQNLYQIERRNVGTNDQNYGNGAKECSRK